MNISAVSEYFFLLFARFSSVLLWICFFYPLMPRLAWLLLLVFGEWIGRFTIDSMQNDWSLSLFTIVLRSAWFTYIANCSRNCSCRFATHITCWWRAVEERRGLLDWQFKRTLSHHTSANGDQNGYLSVAVRERIDSINWKQFQSLSLHNYSNHQTVQSIAAEIEIVVEHWWVCHARTLATGWCDGGLAWERWNLILINLGYFFCCSADFLSDINIWFFFCLRVHAFFFWWREPSLAATCDVRIIYFNWPAILSDKLEQNIVVCGRMINFFSMISGCWTFISRFGCWLWFKYEFHYVSNACEVRWNLYRLTYEIV